MLHMIEARRETLHGAFNAELDPVLSVHPGDRVRCNTVDVGWGTGQHDRESGTRPKIEPRSKPKDNGPGLVGPIHVRGLQPGDTLAVTIDALEPSDWGWTWWGDGPFNPEYLCRVVTRQNQRREAAVRAAQTMQRIVEQ
jgi:acetamidase/formamidase